MNLEFPQRIFEKYSNINYHENPFIGSRVIPCERRTGGRTDRQISRHDEANTCFCSFVNAPDIKTPRHSPLTTEHYISYIYIYICIYTLRNSRSETRNEVNGRHVSLSTSLQKFLSGLSFDRLREKIGNKNEISQRKRDSATLPLCLPPHPPTAQFLCRQSLPKAMCRIGKAI